MPAAWQPHLSPARILEVLASALAAAATWLASVWDPGVAFYGLFVAGVCFADARSLQLQGLKQESHRARLLGWTFLVGSAGLWLAAQFLA